MKVGFAKQNYVYIMQFKKCCEFMYILFNTITDPFLIYTLWYSGITLRIDITVYIIAPLASVQLLNKKFVENTIDIIISMIIES